MADFHELLIRTSRTFGLSIPLLREPCRGDLTLAYLLFRIADTLEDADRLPPAERVRDLRRFRQVLQHPQTDGADELARQWSGCPPSNDAACMDLLREFPALLEAIRQLRRPASEIILRHGARTAEKMTAFVLQSTPDGVLKLTTLDELRQYCYSVAGIVGEMITELFLARQHNLKEVERELQTHAALFGEGLQLVNILKDADDDARQGRVYLPDAVPVEHVFQTARDDLAHAEAYIAALRRCEIDGGIIAFVELPVQLAYQTLNRVEQFGSGAKLTRAEVAQILNQVAMRS